MQPKQSACGLSRQVIADDLNLRRLETGSGLAFEPALALYRKRGFSDGERFGGRENGLNLAVAVIILGQDRSLPSAFAPLHCVEQFGQRESRSARSV